MPCRVAVILWHFEVENGTAYEALRAMRKEAQEAVGSNGLIVECIRRPYSEDFAIEAKTRTRSFRWGKRPPIMDNQICQLILLSSNTSAVMAKVPQIKVSMTLIEILRRTGLSIVSERRSLHWTDAT